MMRTKGRRHFSADEIGGETERSMEEEIVDGSELDGGVAFEWPANESSCS